MNEYRSLYLYQSEDDANAVRALVEAAIAGYSLTPDVADNGVVSVYPDEGMFRLSVFVNSTVPADIDDIVDVIETDRITRPTSGGYASSAKRDA